MSDTKGTGGEGQVRISITVNDRHTFDTNVVTGRQIKEKANVPADFALYRRTHAGNESIPDDDTVELHDGDHVFARPPASRRAKNVPFDRVTGPRRSPRAGSRRRG
jgi:hypothetical protein